GHVGHETVERLDTHAGPCAEYRRHIRQVAGVELARDGGGARSALTLADAAQRKSRSHLLGGYGRRVQPDGLLDGNPENRWALPGQHARVLRRHDADDPEIGQRALVGRLRLAVHDDGQSVARIDSDGLAQDILAPVECFLPMAVRDNRYRLALHLVLLGLEAAPDCKPRPNTAEELACDDLAHRVLSLLADRERLSGNTGNRFERRRFGGDALDQLELQVAGPLPVGPAEGHDPAAALEARMRPQNQIDVKRNERRDGREADREHDDRDQARTRRAPIDA